MKQLVFAILLMAAFGFFAITLRRYIRVVGMGVKDPRPRLDQLGKRLAVTFIYFFGQKKVAERQLPPAAPSFHHLWIFWGFLIITIGTVELLINGLVPSFSFAFLGGPIYGTLKWFVDFFNMVVLIAVGYGFFRRLVLQPQLIPMNLDAGLILGAIAGLMITHFGYHAFHAIAAGHTEIPYAPISSVVAGTIDAMRGPRGANAAIVSDVCYWSHVVIVLSFLNYLPYSKHIHLLGALPNIYTMNLSERTLDIPKANLEDESQWGVGRFEQFSWKSLLDTYACTECARCSNYCPAYATDKPLSPMHLIHDIRYEMLERGTLRLKLEGMEGKLAQIPAPEHHGNGHGDGHGHGHGNGRPEPKSDRELLELEIAAVKKQLDDMPPMVGGRIKDETLWSCTMCGACQESCPVFIEHPLKILQMRQHLVLSAERVPADLARTFRNIERNSNPWGIGADQRMDWAEGLNVPTIEDKPNPEYLLWVGCAGAFDQRIRKQTQAMVKILNAAGVDYAVLGHKEQCTGDPARRGGNEMLFQMQAEANVTTLNAHGVKKVVTSCPHCLHTLKQDYPQFGGKFEVIHHTQLISHLMETGALTPIHDAPRKVVYHDSCYLGRWNGEFEAPRKILRSLPIAGGVLEATRSREKGFCCGAGGARMFMEENVGTRVNSNRTAELVATGAETIAVACPFCNVMMTDGVKELDRDDLAVLDVAEIVAQTLPVLHNIRKSVPVPPQREEGPMGPVAADEEVA
jgi:Fe-S oxidoreductase